MRAEFLDFCDVETGLEGHPNRWTGQLDVHVAVPTTQDSRLN